MTGSRIYRPHGEEVNKDRSHGTPDRVPGGRGRGAPTGSEEAEELAIETHALPFREEREERT